MTSPLDIQTLGAAIPDDPHAVSVCLPTWEDVIGYEEQVPAVLNSFKAGYPRFAFHPEVKKLQNTYCKNKPNEQCIILIDERLAQEAQAFLIKNDVADSYIETIDEHYVVFFPTNAAPIAKDFWQRSGYGIPSRAAEKINNKQVAHYLHTAPESITSHIAKLTEAKPEDVLIYPSGISAVYAVQRAIHSLHPQKATIQFGFPYVDSLKIQEKFGTKVIFEPDSLDLLEQTLQTEDVAAVYCEFPSNPLLKSVDLPKLSALLRKHNVILIVDDTISGYANTLTLPYADIIVSSLTKNFSGQCNIMAGASVLNAQSPHYNTLKKALLKRHVHRYLKDDMEILAHNSQDYEKNTAIINNNAENIAEFFRNEKHIKDVFYPKYIDKDLYNSCKRESGGYGGLLSIVFHHKEDAIAFYDNVRIAKGPSLGTNFTLCCPYTLLAHYHELDWAEQYGISPHLIRIAIGTEDTNELRQIFTNALQHCADITA